MHTSPCTPPQFVTLLGILEQLVDPVSDLLAILGIMHQDAVYTVTDLGAQAASVCPYHWETLPHSLCCSEPETLSEGILEHDR